MADGLNRIGVEPAMWFLIFETRAPKRWLHWLAMGRFKHVSALGWLQDQRAWVHYDVCLGRTRISVMPDCLGASDRIAALREEAVTLAMEGGREPGRWLRLGFWCVPAVAHLVGIKGTPLRPDALYRMALAQGAAVQE